jgi:hypothetical protein
MNRVCLPWLLHRSKQFFDPNGQIAKPTAGCVINCIGNSGCNASHGDFAQPFMPTLLDLKSGELHIDRADVGIHRNDVLGKIGIQETAVSRIDFARFAQRCSEERSGS